MMEHDETVCPGCGEQAAGQEFCPSCGLLIGSFLAQATPAPAPAPASLAEPEPEPEAEPEPEPEPAASPDVAYASPSNPWAAPFTAAERSEDDDDTADEILVAPAAEHTPVAGPFFDTEDPVIAEPETQESTPEPAPPSFAAPFAAPALADEPDEADDDPAGETPEIPAPEVAADEAPAPVVPPMSVHGSNAISAPRASDRRAAVAGMAALLFVFAVLMNRALRR